jgi:hypothetical protein
MVVLGFSSPLFNVQVKSVIMSASNTAAGTAILGAGIFAKEGVQHHEQIFTRLILMMIFKQHTFLHCKHSVLSPQSSEPFTRDQKRPRANLLPKQQPSSAPPLMSTLTEIHLQILTHSSPGLTFRP